MMLQTNPNQVITGMTAALRLEGRKQILELIYRRRVAEGNDGIGAAVERRILTEELAYLEDADTPGDIGIRVDSLDFE